MPPTLGQGGDQAIEDAVALALSLAGPHPRRGTTPRPHPRDGATPGDNLAPRIFRPHRRRLPRRTAVARQAVRATRLGTAGNRAVVAVRDAMSAALAKTGPALLPCGFDGTADRRPPYASGEARVGKRESEST